MIYLSQIKKIRNKIGNEDLIIINSITIEEKDI